MINRGQRLMPFFVSTIFCAVQFVGTDVSRLLPVPIVEAVRPCFARQPLASSPTKTVVTGRPSSHVSSPTTHPDSFLALATVTLPSPATRAGIN